MTKKDDNPWLKKTKKPSGGSKKTSVSTSNRKPGRLSGLNARTGTEPSTPSKQSTRTGALAGLRTSSSSKPSNSPQQSTKVTPADTSGAGTRRSPSRRSSGASSTVTKSNSPSSVSLRRSLQQDSSEERPASTSTTRRTPSMPGRSDQRLIRQPWAGKSQTWAAHVKRAKTLSSKYLPGAWVTVSWKWDAGTAFSTRPDATNDSFGGYILKYDELGQMHLQNERAVQFVIPCAHITSIKGDITVG